MRVLYFGCDDRPGHYLHHPGMKMATWDPGAERHAKRPWPDIPWAYIDGSLCPGVTDPEGWRRPDDQPEGAGALHHKEDWTAWAFWDRTVDRRGNCNSVFFAEGTHDLAAMQALAQVHFPGVWARVKHLPFTIEEPTT